MPVKERRRKTIKAQINLGAFAKTLPKLAKLAMTRTPPNYKHKGKRPKRKIKMYPFANTAEKSSVSGWGVFPLDAEVRNVQALTDLNNDE